MYRWTIQQDGLRATISEGYDAVIYFDSYRLPKWYITYRRSDGAFCSIDGTAEGNLEDVELKIHAAYLKCEGES